MPCHSKLIHAQARLDSLFVTSTFGLLAECILCIMIIDEIRNSKFNFQLNIITTLIFGNQCCLFQELTVGPLFSLSFPSTMIYKNQTGKQQNENTQQELTVHPENGSKYLSLELSKITFYVCMNDDYKCLVPTNYFYQHFCTLWCLFQGT